MITRERSELAELDKYLEYEEKMERINELVDARVSEKTRQLEETMAAMLASMAEKDKIITSLIWDIMKLSKHVRGEP